MVAQHHTPLSVFGLEAQSTGAHANVPVLRADTDPYAAFEQTSTVEEQIDPDVTGPHISIGFSFDR